MAAGKTVTVRVSGGSPDYTSLQAALDGEAADFTSASTGSVVVGGKTWTGIALHIECDPAGGNDTTRTTMDQAGWALDVSHRVLISTVDSAWPSTSSSFVPGGTGFYSLVCDNPGFYCFKVGVNVDDGGLVVSGLEVRQTNTGSVADDCIQDVHSSTGGEADKVIYDSIVCKNSSSSSDAPCWSIENRHVRIQNCYAESVGGDGYRFDTGLTSYDCDVFANLAVNCGGDGFATDVSMDGTCRMLNNVAYNCTGSGFSGGDTFEAASNNASDDATHPGTSGQTITGADFENAGTDWTPASGGNLISNGANLVSGGYISNEEDGVGYTRVNWDAGPIERQSSSGQTVIVPTGPWY